MCLTNKLNSHTHAYINSQTPTHAERFIHSFIRMDVYFGKFIYDVILAVFKYVVTPEKAEQMGKTWGSLTTFSRREVTIGVLSITLGGIVTGWYTRRIYLKEIHEIEARAEASAVLLGLPANSVTRLRLQPTVPQQTWWLHAGEERLLAALPAASTGAGAVLLTFHLYKSVVRLSKRDVAEKARMRYTDAETRLEFIDHHRPTFRHGLQLCPPLFLQRVVRYNPLRRRVKVAVLASLALQGCLHLYPEGERFLLSFIPYEAVLDVARRLMPAVIEYFPSHTPALVLGAGVTGAAMGLKSYSDHVLERPKLIRRTAELMLSFEPSPVAGGASPFPASAANAAPAGDVVRRGSAAASPAAVPSPSGWGSPHNPSGSGLSNNTPLTPPTSSSYSGTATASSQNANTNSWARFSESQLTTMREHFYRATNFTPLHQLEATTVLTIVLQQRRGRATLDEVAAMLYRTHLTCSDFNELIRFFVNYNKIFMSTLVCMVMEDIQEQLEDTQRLPHAVVTYLRDWLKDGLHKSDILAEDEGQLLGYLDHRVSRDELREYFRLHVSSKCMRESLLPRLLRFPSLFATYIRNREQARERELCGLVESLANHIITVAQKQQQQQLDGAAALGDLSDQPSDNEILHALLEDVLQQQQCPYEQGGGATSNPSHLYKSSNSINNNNVAHSHAKTSEKGEEEGSPTTGPPLASSLPPERGEKGRRGTRSRDADGSAAAVSGTSSTRSLSPAAATTDDALRAKLHGFGVPLRRLEAMKTCVQERIDAMTSK